LTLFNMNVVAAFYAGMTAQSAWRQSSAEFIRAFPVPQGNQRLRVLDLGCGPGVSALAMLQAKPDLRVYGLDISAPMLSEAKRYSLHAGVAFPLLRADALHLPVAPQSVDVVTGHSFLYLLPDRNQGLAETYRVLRPGGVLALLEPARKANPFVALRSHWREGRYMLSMFLWRVASTISGGFSQASLTDLIRQNRFQQVQVRTVLETCGLQAIAIRP